jgi:hypothetical protein
MPPDKERFFLHMDGAEYQFAQVTWRAGWN